VLVNVKIGFLFDGRQVEPLKWLPHARYHNRSSCMHWVHCAMYAVKLPVY